MKMKFPKMKLNLVGIFLSMLFISFSLVIYNSLISEFDYGLMIDRGFVSCNAHYFSLQTDNKIDQDSNTSNKYITQEIIKGRAVAK